MERKFTDDEIVKAYEACLCVNCRICPLADVDDCESRVEIGIPEIYNRQKAEIERLTAIHADMNESLRLAAEANKDMVVELKAMRGAANSYKAEIERLEQQIENYEMEDELKWEREVFLEDR